MDDLAKIAELEAKLEQATYENSLLSAQLDRASATIAQLEGQLEYSWNDGYATGVAPNEKLRGQVKRLEAELHEYQGDDTTVDLIKSLQAENERLWSVVNAGVSALNELREAARSVLESEYEHDTLPITQVDPKRLRKLAAVLEKTRPR